MYTGSFNTTIPPQKKKKPQTAKTKYHKKIKTTTTICETNKLKNKKKSHNK